MMIGYVLLGLGVMLLAGAWLARDAWPLDAKLLLLCAIVAIGHALLRQLSGTIPHNRLGAIVYLLFGVQTLYLTGAGAGIWFFLTKMRGWLRAYFLLYAVAALSPFIIFVILAVMFMIA